MRAVLSASVVAILGIVMGSVMLASQGPKPAEAASVFVFSPADSGFGSFRAAVEAANSNPFINLIVLKNTVPITLYSQVTYTGSQSLTIQGDHALIYRTIQGTGSGADAATAESYCDGDALFRSVGGADLTFYQVRFANTYCSGVIVEASDDDEVIVTLNKTIIENMDGYGLNMYEDGDGTSSFTLNMTDSRVEHTSICFGDAVDVDEWGSGSIKATISGSSISNNGGAGLELEEEGTGDDTLTAKNSNFNNNGMSYINSLSPGVADDAAAEALDDGGPDAQCCDYQGIYMEERDDGKTTASLTTVQANHNAGNGIDIHEHDKGDLSFTGNGVTADDNCDDGIHVREYDSGKLGAKLTAGHTWNNWDDGTDVDENGSGDYSFEATGSSSNFNDSDGYDLDENSDGNAIFKFSTVVANGNDDDGLDLYAGDTGDFTATVYTSTVTFNGDEAVDATSDGNTGTIAFGTSTITGGTDLTNINVIP